MNLKGPQCRELAEELGCTTEYFRTKLRAAGLRFPYSTDKMVLLRAAAPHFEPARKLLARKLEGSSAAEHEAPKVVRPIDLVIQEAALVRQGAKAVIEGRFRTKDSSPYTVGEVHLLMVDAIKREQQR